VGFEPTIPAFERAKTIHALNRAATVIGLCIITEVKSSLSNENDNKLIKFMMFCDIVPCRKVPAFRGNMLIPASV
jgi:hypothetical protein